jgi:hypothetical protein
MVVDLDHLDAACDRLCLVIGCFFLAGAVVRFADGTAWDALPPLVAVAIVGSLCGLYKSLRRCLDRWLDRKVAEAKERSASR